MHSLVYWHYYSAPAGKEPLISCAWKPPRASVRSQAKGIQFAGKPADLQASRPADLQACGLAGLQGCRPAGVRHCMTAGLQDRKGEKREKVQGWQA